MSVSTSSDLREQVNALDAAVALFNALPFSVFAKDLECRFVSVNRVMRDTFGFEHRSDLIGLDDFDLHPPEQAEVYLTIDRQILTTGEPVWDMQELQTRADGSVAVIRTSKLPVRNNSGDIVGLMGYSIDETNTTQVSEALALSEERYALAARATRDGIWDYHAATDELTMSARCAQILDMPVSTAPVPWTEVAGRVGAGQMTLLRDRLTQAEASSNDSFSVDIEFELASGEQRWVNIVGTVITVDGARVRIVGSTADITADREREAQLRHQARHDDLTGLQNRRALIDALATTDASLLYLDLDEFKVVNDSLGHIAGDELLVGVAERLSRTVGAHADVYRVGGDEFAVLLPTDIGGDPVNLGDHINDRLRRPFRLSGIDVYTTASIGIVCGVDRCNDALAMLRDADIALYAAKADGKAQSCVFEPAMRTRAEDALELQMRIRRAVELDEFEMHYQPIADSRSGALIGVEALIRWRRPDGTYESPAGFLPYLEDTNLIVPVGRWVIDTACAQLARWRAEFPAMRDISLSLNISRAQFDAADLSSEIGATVERHGLQPHDIVIEITETAVTNQSDSMHSCLDALRSMGFRVAIDDFGVGQSSLSTLYDLPADILKIDRSFVSRVHQGEPEPIMESVLQIARALDMTTVAEGVETAEQAAWLVEHGCDRLQGFLLARPMPASKIPSTICR